MIDRDALLVAAERVIRRDGPGVSIDAIAAEAGVTKPTVYARIGDRTDLAHALAERFVDRVVLTVGRAASGEVDPQLALRTFVLAHLTFVADERNVYLYITNGAGGEEGVDRTLFLTARSAEPLAEQLAAFRTDAGSDPVVALPWAYAMIGTLHMVALWWLRQPDRPLAELADAVSELLWHGIAG